MIVTNINIMTFCLICRHRNANINAGLYKKAGNFPMGKIIRLHCPQCGYEKELFVGGGMLDCELKTILNVLPEEGKRMLAAAANYGANQFSVTRKFCVCDSCGTIYALPVVSYNMKGICQEIYGVCPNCGAEGNTRWNENQVPPCPDCGGEMTQRETGHWD